jgi:glycosyltransferase involved in cell wall biosynthesis
MIVAIARLMFGTHWRALDISILICTRNRRCLLNETLDSLAEMSVPSGWRCEVLVVDNHSTDGTMDSVLARAADYPLPLRCLEEPIPGKSSAMNTGIAAANGARMHGRRCQGQP